MAAAERAGHRGLRLAILSNAPAEVADEIDEAPWLAAFSRRFFSCRLKAVKPEAAAYRAVLDALGAEPGEVVFFDDRPANVAGAAAARNRCPSVRGAPPSWTSSSGPETNHPSATVRTSAPSSVTTRVCSNWAVRRPSAVTAVQPLSHIFSRQVPMVIIGSMVKVIPGCMIVDASAV